MIKFAFKNIKLLNFFSNIPILKHFFVLKLSIDFHEVTNRNILNKFYTDIYVKSKTSKKTEAERFADLDKFSLKYLKKNQENLIHDIAVSSGITSIELYNYLNIEDVKFRLSISEKYSEIFVDHGFITRAYDSDNHFIFF